MIDQRFAPCAPQDIRNALNDPEPLRKKIDVRVDGRTLSRRRLAFRRPEVQQPDNALSTWQPAASRTGSPEMAGVRQYEARRVGRSEHTSMIAAPLRRRLPRPE